MRLTIVTTYSVIFGAACIAVAIAFSLAAEWVGEMLAKLI